MVADLRRHLSARGCQKCHARQRECETGFPANTTHSPNAGAMLCQRRRRWPNNVPHCVNVSCLLLVGKAQSCCIVCLGLLTKHADWPTFTDTFYR